MISTLDHTLNLSAQLSERICMKTKQFKNIGYSLGVVTLLGAFFLLVSCAPSRNSIEQASTNITDSLGCTDVKSKVFDALYDTIDQDQKNLTANELKTEVHQKINKVLATKKLTLDEQQVADRLFNQVDSLLETMLADAEANPSLGWKEQIQNLIRYEMENESSAQMIKTHQQISKLTSEVKSLSQKLNIECQNPTVPTTESAKLDSVGVAGGMNRVFTTLYQSCKVEELPDMDARTPAVSGISVVGKHSDGIGNKREITNLGAVQSTHYYIRGIAPENSSCYMVKDNPPIYDYGGEPSVSSAGRQINLFKNAGTGSKALGIDCSAYVSSGIAAAGLRYKPSVANKPIFIRMTSSDFINAKKSGFSCFDNVTVSSQSSVKPGDIVAVVGHVVEIDKVGSDPFGLRFVSNINGCSSLNYKDFDITITQSSPSKGAIGVNKFKIKDYLDETTKMRNAFVQMGYYACLAKFQGKSYKPEQSAWGFIRHKDTTECKDERVAMTGESCVQSCW